MELSFLREIVIIFSLSIAVILLCHRLKVPAIVGFLLTGVVVGPHALGVIKEVANVEVFAEIGIVLLLFSVGMEFSLSKIFEYRRFFLIGGFTQVGLSVLITAVIALAFGRPFGEAIFFGFLLALSSTAIVLGALADKSESNTPHGNLAVGILIFQDIIAIPAMLFTPLLGGEGLVVKSDALFQMGVGILLLVAVLFAAYKVVPRLLYMIAKTRSRELFLLSVLTICFSVALLTSEVGLSLSLGAFLAGLIVSESEYRHEAIGDILPFKDVFTSFFFVSIGMLLDVGFFLSQPFVILFVTLCVLILKIITGGVAALFLKMPIRTAILTGIALCQIGEFSFVLAKNGFNYGLIDDYRYQIFLAVSLLTMGLTPTLISWSSTISSLLMRLPFPVKWKSGISSSAHKAHAEDEGHVVIVGFGLIGRHIAKSARDANIPYIVLEMNPETVRKEKENGEPIHFGDATHEIVLKHLGVASAKVAAVVINDSTASHRIVTMMRSLNPDLYILVRTHYSAQIHGFYQAGASEVVSDEVVSSVEIFSRMMHLFHTPEDVVKKHVDDVKMATFTKLQNYSKLSASLYDLKYGFSSVSIKNLKIEPNCEWVGKPLEAINIRNAHGINVIAIKRNGEFVSCVDAYTIIMDGDILTVAGEHKDLEKACEFLKPSMVS